MAIITCKPGENGQQSPYKGEIVFHFKSLKPENVSQVEDTISEVFQQSGTDQQVNGGSAQTQQADIQSRRQSDSQSPAADPPSIEKGQSIYQVLSALGQPEKKVKLGAKQMYFYKNMKITFVDGKVDDVQ